MTEEQRTAAAPSVLVIDDSDVVRLFVVHAISAIGYTATAAATTEEALNIVENHPSLRVLVCELSLGPMSGPEFVRKALRNRPELRVIFIARHSENISFRKTDPLLVKPFHLHQLRNAIETVLNNEAPLGPLSSAERRRSVRFRSHDGLGEEGIA
jgi:two-component system, cell cycle sensor histidine kinase and response regulator CckA